MTKCIFILIFISSGLFSVLCQTPVSIDLQLKNSESTTDSIHSYLKYSEYYWKEKRNLNNATIYALKARKLSLLADNKPTLAHCDYLLGTFMGVFKIHDKSNEFLLRALEYYKPLNDSSLLYKIFNNLGSNYIGLDSVDKSIEYFHLSLNEKSKFQDSCIKSSTYFNLALAYAKLDNDSTAYYLSKVADLSLQCNDTNNFVKALYILSDFNISKNQKLKAANNLSTALKFQNGTSTGVVFDLYYRLAKVHAHRQSITAFNVYLDTLQRKYETSKNNIDFKIKLLELDLLKDSLDENFKGAYENRIKINSIKDSVENASRKIKEQNFKIILETENLAQIITQLDETNRLQQKVGFFIKLLNILGGIVIFMLLMLLIGYIFGIRERVRQRKIITQINDDLSLYNQTTSQKNDELILLGHRLKQLNNELKTENEHKDRIVSIIGSDIRKPLDVLLHASDSLNRHFNDAKTFKLLTLINQTGTLLEHQLNDIIAWFIIQGQRFGNDEKHNLKKLLNSIQEIVKIKHKDLSISFDSSIRSGIDLEGDGRALRYIFRYILEKALELGFGKSVIVSANENNGIVKIALTSDFGGGASVAKKISSQLGKKFHSHDSHYLIYRDFLRYYRCKVETLLQQDVKELVISIQFA